MAGGQLVLGRSTFWWEDTSGVPNYTYMRVVAPALTGSGPATVVKIAGLTAPADQDRTAVNGVSATPASNATNAVAADTGLDQAPLTVQVATPSSATLPYDPAVYDRIYYRDGSGNLVTNLFLAKNDLSEFIAIDPYPGAYSNDTPGALDSAGTRHYIAATSNQSITPLLGGNGGAWAPGTAFNMVPVGLSPQVAGGSQLGSGIGLSGCTDFVGSFGTCRLASSPAPYINYGVTPARLGVLTTNAVTTSASSLPLVQSGTTTNPLATVTLTVSDGVAKLPPNTPNPYATRATVDGALVTHGQLLQFTQIASGGTDATGAARR